MITGVSLVAILVRDYEAAIDFYCGKLGFVVVEDSPLPSGKRWLRLKSPGQTGTELLLSKAVDTSQKAAIGNQAGGRVFLFLNSDNLDADYESLSSQEVEFLEPPRQETYGRVAVFKDLYGNRIDLIQPLRDSQ